MSHSRLAGMKPCSLTFHIYHRLLCSYFPWRDSWCFFPFTVIHIQFVRLFWYTHVHTPGFGNEQKTSKQCTECSTIHGGEICKLKTQQTNTGIRMSSTPWKWNVDKSEFPFSEHPFILSDRFLATLPYNWYFGHVHCEESINSTGDLALESGILENET